MSAAPAATEGKLAAVEPVGALSDSILSSLVADAEVQGQQAAVMGHVADSAASEQQRQQQAALLSLDNAELAQAATRIQAAFRGRQARKHLPLHGSAGSAAATLAGAGLQDRPATELTAAAADAGRSGEGHDELAVLDDAQLAQAATRIQAIYRGRQTRRALATAHSEAPQQRVSFAGPEAGTPPAAEAQQDQLEAALAAASDAELAQAATRIQAIYRGRQARKHMTARAAALVRALGNCTRTPDRFLCDCAGCVMHSPVQCRAQGG